MKLKKIKLQNIRSYIEEEVEFSDGTTLLSGDIGCGKTSILLAIEFALFGLQPGQRGNSLLKNGAESGGVMMIFEVDGQEVIIERTLKRGKTISQDYASITVDCEKREISVTELKSKVLDLLNYPKEFSKKQNLLYRFTVYTPQEEMKQIILQDPATRINTLRHVFGIDKYKKILENSSVVLAKVREDIRLKEGITINLEQDRSLIKTKENDLLLKIEHLHTLEGELLLKIEKRRKVEGEKEEISKKIREREAIQKEIEKTKIMMSTKNESIMLNLKKIDQLKEQIEELNKLKFDEEEIKKMEEYIRLKKIEKTKLNDENLEIASETSALNLKNRDSDGIKEKLKIIEVCPTCLQDVNQSYKENVLGKMDLNIEKNKSRIAELNLRRQEVITNMEQIEREIGLREKEVQDLKIIKIRLQGIDEKRTSINEIEKHNVALNSDLEMLARHNDVLKRSVLQLNTFDGIFEAKQKELDSVLKEERLADIRVAELKKEIDMIGLNICELEAKIKLGEKVRDELNYLVSLENWLSKKFIPLISFTEKNVMAKLKLEFSQLFGEWFGMLVADNFSVRLSDDFTPIIEQQDYDIEYNYLSGGERTAIALAYRLALNQVINSMISKIKTKDLVILDEPTDGFSDQQLDKMRDVLQELNVSQLIIVSHEQKIESFVDNVIKLKKENGMSAKSS